MQYPFGRELMAAKDQDLNIAAVHTRRRREVARRSTANAFLRSAFATVARRLRRTPAPERDSAPAMAPWSQPDTAEEARVGRGSS